MMTDDLDLVIAWQGGDGGAGERLIERHLESVHRFFSNKVRVGTEDLVQQTFLACMESVASFEGRASFRAYLFGIARNVLYGHFRNELRGFDPLTSSSGAGLAQSQTPADVVAEAEEQRLLLAALRTLPLELQTLVELAYWEGLSDGELADALDVPIGTIKSRLRKARQTLDETLPKLAKAGERLDTTRRTLASWAARVRGDHEIAGGRGRR
ncbi:MAG: sigma-70 family RNA polymerase sigma factor [Myxococcota bacterium]